MAPALYWAPFLLGVSLPAAGWLFYRFLLGRGRSLLRLENERKDAFRQHFFHTFRVNDGYDSDNILVDVVYRDEYGITRQRFDPGDVIIDVGANIGAFTFLCHRLGSRAIHAYEPGRQNFELLKSNVGSLPGVHPFQSAVWRSDRAAHRQLTLYEGPNSGAHSVLAAGCVPDFETQTLLAPSATSYATTGISLDAILEKFPRVKLLKIDCEGSEFPILLTSRHLHRVERIVGEAHEQGEDFMSALDEDSRVAGYSTYRIEDLTARLKSVGFSVTSFSGHPHIYWFDARREIQAAEMASPSAPDGRPKATPAAPEMLCPNFHGRPGSKNQLAFVFYATDETYAVSALVFIRLLRDLGVRDDADLVLLHLPLPQHILQRFKRLGVATRAIARVLTVTRWGFRYCLAKMQVFALAGYERIVYLDADSFPLKNLDELLSMPLTQSLAAPRAYWLPQPYWTSALFAAKPSILNWKRVEPHLSQAIQTGDLDMEIINSEFSQEIQSLPPHVFSLDSEWEDVNRPSFFPHPAEASSQVSVVHFTSLGKPWMYSAAEERRLRPNAFPIFHDLREQWRSTRDAVLS